MDNVLRNQIEEKIENYRMKLVKAYERCSSKQRVYLNWEETKDILYALVLYTKELEDTLKSPKRINNSEVLSNLYKQHRELLMDLYFTRRFDIFSKSKIPPVLEWIRGDRQSNIRLHNSPEFIQFWCALTIPIDLKKLYKETDRTLLYLASLYEKMLSFLLIVLEESNKCTATKEEASQKNIEAGRYIKNLFRILIPAKSSQKDKRSVSSNKETTTRRNSSPQEKKNCLSCTERFVSYINGDIDYDTMLG